MIYYLVARRHARTMTDFLANWGKPLARRIRVLPYEDLFSGDRVQLPPATYIFTSLGRDLGSRNPPSRERDLVSRLHDSLVSVCGPRRVLNDPVNFLSRYELLRALERQGINRFVAYRADAETPRRFPVFLRPEHGTVREAPPLLRNRQEYDAALRAAGPRGDLIAVEHRDTADAAGVYRKYGCFIVGERIVPRHLFFSHNWLVKGAELREPAMVREEAAYVESGDAHEPLLRLVARMANLAWGRMDYALLDGRPQVWEINITPALEPLDPAADDPARRPAHGKFVERLAQALDAIDPPAG